ncbi:hypothetical protein [Mycoplasmopsis glycophila]|uniref:Uncharacterized protein n=1 Tax=Mycoplasmopsis glycophila TaxID=171285 RepID=A0A449AVQ0_9BACT|nr:hypothetical protein [Mycoplasmopsis glycophila]VEU70669.1 Uncharacterised protein [Mycoplasmopsis glycophila]
MTYERKNQNKQFQNEMYGTFTSNVEKYTSQKDPNQIYYILTLKIQKGEQVKYYPFWYFQPKDYQKVTGQSMDATIQSLIHNFCAVSFEQEPSSSGTVINVIKKVSAWMVNENTNKKEYVPVIDNYAYYQAAKQSQIQAKREDFLSNTTTKPQKQNEETKVKEFTEEDYVINFPNIEPQDFKRTFVLEEDVNRGLKPNSTDISNEIEKDFSFEK